MAYNYPWYNSCKGIELEQGDIFRGYPVFMPDPYVFTNEKKLPDVEGEFITSDVILMTQSCDLENDKIDSVILCPLHILSGIEKNLGNSEREIKKRKESIRQGKEPGMHMIKNDTDLGIELSLVEFKRIYTTPKSTLVEFAKVAGNRVRLLPPYREHLSQAFARYFMRVGLPQDISSFSSN